MFVLKKTSDEPPPEQPKPKTEEGFLPVFEELGFVAKDKTNSDKGIQVFGSCIFCGSEKKFYINPESGQFSCKVCGEQGNVYSFLTAAYIHYRQIYPLDDSTDVLKLAENRELNVDTILDAGLFYDGTQYAFPVRNPKGAMVNFQRFYYPASPIKIRSLPILKTALMGVHEINEKTKRIWVCEGPWDLIATKAFFTLYGFGDELLSGEWIVLAVPGAGTWKTEWNKILENLDVCFLYDNDSSGRKGSTRALDSLGAGNKFRKRRLEYLRWPEGLPDGFDMRDYFRTGGDYETFTEMIKEAEGPQPIKKIISQHQIINGDIPSFNETMETYARWIKMTSEHVNILKITFAVVLSNFIKGDPLWIHIVASPSSGKTEVLMSVADCSQVITASSITPHGLISGFPNHGGKDPSLLPNLIDNIFVLKDFTEVLQMPKTSKDEVYAILRGAYDGEVYRKFGNGIVREYYGHFSMIAGVTVAIDGESDSTMGERFLKYRMKDQSAKSRKEVIREALSNVGHEDTMRAELREAACRFLDRPMDSFGALEIDDRYTEAIVTQAELLCHLRAHVERDYSRRERILYKPGIEMGPRIAKQLKKLLIGLAQLNDPPRVTDEDVQLVAKVAAHSCIPFNVVIVMALLKNPGLTVEEVSEKINIPLSTIKEHFDNLHLLGVLTKERQKKAGRLVGSTSSTCWYVTEEIEQLWRGSQLPL